MASTPISLKTLRKPVVKAVAAALASMAATAAAQSLPPTLNLATDPLLGPRPLHPNVALALSVEFPTVGAAFNRIAYTASTKYVGYFNSSSCYTYNSGSEYFVPAGATATDYSCSGASFSGNFLNWATMSSIDIFRYAMTGGFRITDTNSRTVLARTFLPNGNITASGQTQPSNFYAHNSYFARRWVSTTETGNNNNIATVAPNTVTPFSRTRISVVNCRDQVLFGEWDSTTPAPTCDAPRRDARFASDPAAVVRRYRVRVQVCDDTEGPDRGDLCGIYRDNGSPIYKPIGQIQKNADNMRFSAFGYITDQSTARYGGVMRSAMKYAGPNLYDSAFRLSGTNPTAEWSATTGIYSVNPESAAEGNSGVVNYLNKFGNVTGAEGMYKQYDPVGELYYESLRYLEGKDPTPAATSGMTVAMKQGFPVVTNWSASDPLMCAAQPQYIIAIADTNAWADKTIPGNPGGSPYNSLSDASRAVEADNMNVAEWTRKVGLKAKADGLLPLTGGGITSTQADTLDTWVHGNGGNRGNNFYMAGLSYWAKNEDIRPDDPAKPKSLGKQNVSTITIDVAEPSALLPRERQLFLAGAYGSDAPATNPNWAMADNPQRLIDAIEAAFARVASTSGSLGGGTVTAGIFESGETGVYVPEFSTSSWYGDLKFYPLSPVLDAGGNPTGDVTIATTPSWKASTGIPVFDEATQTDTRNIILGNALGGGAAFQWINLTGAQQTQLDTNPNTQQQDGNGQARLNYLRGSRIDEGVDPADFVGELPEGADGTATGAAKPFRVRTNLLGDIVNSSPVFVGKPRGRISDALVPTASFRDWSTNSARANRTRVVYVGTNGGMVHGFNAATGAEVMAYVPSVMLPKLPKLTHPGYRHAPFIDGPLTATEAYALNGWKTVLAGAFGGGAKGVFALDVTDPSSFSGSNVLWEFSNADDADMGHVTGKVLITPMRIRQADSTIATRWFIVTASGFNNYGDGAGGDNANGYIFLLSLDKASGTAWQQGTNYYKIQIPFDSASTAAMGLAQPGGVFDRLGALTRLYAGDLRGNLWRVDVNDTTPAYWSVAFSGSPVFVATDGNGNRQPITVAPTVAFGPGRGYLLSFGSGRLLATGDTTARAVSPGVTAFDSQTFYTVWDDLNSTVGSGRSKLASRTVDLATGDISGAAFVYGNTSSNKRGWYVDYPAATSDGERSISSAVLNLGRVFFNSIIPGADPCVNGQSRTFAVDAVKGAGRTFGTQAGYLAAPLVLRTQLLAGSPDPTGYRGDTVKSALINLGTEGREVSNQPSTVVPAGAWTWRELLNWRELRRSAP